MAKTDRCPICNVAVKPENLVRHLNDIHPRHPDTPGLRGKLEEEPGRVAPKRAAKPLRIRSWQVVVVVVLVTGGVGAYLIGPYFSPSTGQVFPCVTGALVYHWHTQVTIDASGTPVTIPSSVGLTAICAEPLHTHDISGTIHVETDLPRFYSIGDFFRVWGKSFDSPTQMLVNGSAVTPSPNVILYDRETIALSYASFG